MPTYVRQQDVENEARVMSRFASMIPGASVKPLPPGAAYDGEIYQNDKLVALCEVKCRLGAPDRYENWQIALKKLQSYSRHSAAKQVPAFLLYSWDGHLFYWKIKDIDALPVKISGRYDRNDPKDVEPMAQIPSSFFKRIP